MRTILAVLLIALLMTVAACGGDAPAETPVGAAATATAADGAAQVPTGDGGGIAQQPTVGGAEGATQQSDDGAQATTSGDSAERATLPPIPTSTTVATTTPNPDIPEAEVTVDLTAALAGTAVITEDPLAGQPFDSLLFYQTGGASNETLTIELFNDGRLVRNGSETRVDAEVIAAVNTALNTVGFYTLQDIYSPPVGRTDAFSYTLLVRRGELEYQISANDGGLTANPALAALFVTVRNLGVTNTFGVPAAPTP